MHPWPKRKLFTNFGTKSGNAKNIDLTQKPDTILIMDSRLTIFWKDTMRSC